MPTNIAIRRTQYSLFGWILLLILLLIYIHIYIYTNNLLINETQTLTPLASRLPKRTIWTPFPSCTRLRVPQKAMPFLPWGRGMASQNCEACATILFHDVSGLVFMFFFFQDYWWWVVRSSETIEMENRAHQLEVSLDRITLRYMSRVYVWTFLWCCKSSHWCICCAAAAAAGGIWH